MLAPRKKLWSTPSSAVDVALDFASPLKPEDVVFDVGCGDGRVLIQMASRSVVPAESDTARDFSSRSCAADGERTAGRRQQDHHYCRQFVGIEISEERAAEARRNVQAARETEEVPSHVQIDIICANALDTEAIDYSRATVIFLYLVPRGLRLIRPIVWPEVGAGGGAGGADASEGSGRLRNGDGKVTRRIITYMSPFEGVDHQRKECCEVDHQSGAAWPVYLYEVT
mmetsp:Transcript_20522/g.46398  ORF Transcript_20522/g.46398 Transcript_20522/m.46398 type:complete len:227 (-) Transcript_20522:53-733(-)